MENIIAQQLVKMQGAILEKIREEGLKDIGKTAEALLRVVKENTCELLQAILETTDTLIAEEAKASRKADGLKIKERNVKRSLQTSLGEIEYRRTYYETAEGEYVYLLDHLIGVEPYERVSKALCAKLVNLAAEMSFGKSVSIGEAEVSRQTVSNKVNALREVVQDVERVEETPEELHLFADEDHVHLKDGRNAIVPLVTISEGIDTSNPKRHRLINPLHIAGYGMEAEAFNDQVEACVYERYDLDKVKRIYIHGDGASRIISLGDRFPNAEHVLDGFHLEKYLKKLGHYNGAAQRMGALRAALRDGNWKTYKKLLEDIYTLQNGRDRERCKEIVRYLWNNRQAAHLRYDPDICGSCTESLVSHVLSERLSRTPLAWSERGLEMMAMLVVYRKNGREITSKDIRVSLTREAQDREVLLHRNGWDKYNGYMNRQIDSILDADWASAFEKQAVSFGKVDASFVIRKAFASLCPAI
ncbi:MAG: ISLre2 family transposase [Eubacteriales bacterium]|nr:ISLre2 family transposase [Eubacteriales bacterium]